MAGESLVVGGEEGRLKASASSGDWHMGIEDVEKGHAPIMERNGWEGKITVAEVLAFLIYLNQA